MSNKDVEKLSEFLDGELEAQQACHLADKLTDNPFMQKKFDQYALVSGMLREQHIVPSEPTLLSKIRQALQNDAHKAGPAKG